MGRQPRFGSVVKTQPLSRLGDSEEGALGKLVVIGYFPELDQLQTLFTYLTSARQFCHFLFFIFGRIGFLK